MRFKYVELQSETGKVKHEIQTDAELQSQTGKACWHIKHLPSKAQHSRIKKKVLKILSVTPINLFIQYIYLT